MSFKLPYQQKNYMGEYIDDSAALAFIQASRWDTTKDGTGNPEDGMWYFNTTSASPRIWRSGSWQAFHDADEIPVATGGFSGILGPGNTNVQSALATIDTHTHSSSSITDFTEAAQDAVGGALVDSTTIDFTYDDGLNTITAIVKDDSIDVNKLAHNIDTTAIGFNATSVNGASLNDAGNTSTDLLSAQEINSRISSVANGLDPKESVRMASTQDLTAESFGASGVVYNGLAGTLTQSVPGDGVFGGVDGVSALLGDRVAIVNQTSGVQNGIYEVTAIGDGSVTPWVLTRTADFATGDTVAGAYFVVEEGTSYGDNFLLCTSDQGADTVNTHPLVFTTFGSVTSHNALTGLQGGVAGQYYHLTTAQHSGLTGGADTTLHHHDSRYYTETELSNTGAGTEGAALIGTDTKPNLGNATTVEAGLTFINANMPRIFTGVATNPNGTVTPDKVGDFYISTTAPLLRYINVDATNTGWRVI